MPAADDDTLLPFSLPSLSQKKVTAAFDGGVFLLAGGDKRLSLIDRLAALFPDPREPAQITHSITDLPRERVFAVACGYPDGNDLDDLRMDPAFKMACGRRPDPPTGAECATVLASGKVRCSPVSPCSRERARCAWLRVAPLLSSSPLRAVAPTAPGRGGKAGSPIEQKSGFSAPTD